MPLHKDKRMIAFRTVVVAVIVFIVAGFAIARLIERNTEQDVAFPIAQCLTEKGVAMYGAYWCPHCSRQKKDFGRAFSRVTYVECAVPGNPNAQTQACQDAGIDGYPTWVFPDGRRMGGVQTLEALALAAGCNIPGSEASDDAAIEAVEDGAIELVDVDLVPATDDADEPAAVELN